jgi:hypothetical protein
VCISVIGVCYWRLDRAFRKVVKEKLELYQQLEDIRVKLLSYSDTVNHANSLVRAFMQPAEHFDIGRSLKGKTTVFAFHGEDRYFNVVKVFDSSDADANEKRARDLVKMLEE